MTTPPQHSPTAVPIPSPPIVPAAVHWDEVLRREFSKESDRACVIVAVALLDSALETMLRAVLVPSATGGDSLLEGAYAPVSTFSARIDLAFRLGLISGKFARDLHLIRRIRNDFAHNISGCSFEDSAVRSRVLELSRSSAYGERNPHVRANFPDGPKGDFQLAAGWMQWYLRHYIETVTAVNEAPLEWGYTMTLDNPGTSPPAPGTQSK